MYSYINYWISRERFSEEDRLEIFLTRDDRSIISSHCVCSHGTDWSCKNSSCSVAIELHKALPEGAIRVARYRFGTHDMSTITRAIQRAIQCKRGGTAEDLHISLIEQFSDVE